MGWLKRMFGQEAATGGGGGGGGATAEAVPAERLGLNGEYDESGLAKRVAQAFDNEADLRDIDTVWVAQTGGTVVLKGQAPSTAIIDRLVAVAQGINGATDVDASQLTVG